MSCIFAIREYGKGKALDTLLFNYNGYVLIKSYTCLIMNWFSDKYFLSICKFFSDDKLYKIKGLCYLINMH